MQVPAIFVEQLSDAGAGAGAGVVAVVAEEPLEAMRVANLLLLSTAEHLTIFIPSFLRMGHFDGECLLPQAELWQMMHLSDELERLLRQQEMK